MGRRRRVGPGARLAQEDIGKDDQLAHHRDGGDLVAFSGGLEPPEEALQVGVVG